MNSLVSSETIRKDLAAIWPRLQFVVLSDAEWWAPGIDDLRAFMAGIEPLPYIERIYECEEQSLELVASQRRAHAAMGAGPLANWPLGIVCGTRFRGQTMDHWQNICRCDSGIYLIEPQTREIWSPRPDMDHIYFVLM